MEDLISKLNVMYDEKEIQERIQKVAEQIDLIVHDLKELLDKA